MNKVNEAVMSFYLDYVNEFVTVEDIAEHYRLSPKAALMLINVGKDLHEKRVVKLGMRVRINE